jgi:hypothetical protein
VDGEVAEFADEVTFAVEGVAEEVFEAGFKYFGAEVVFVGFDEVVFDAVEPVDGEFEGAAAVEAGGAGVGVGKVFGFGGGFVEFWPLFAEKLKMLAHRSRLSN